MKNFVCAITPNPALDLGGVVDALNPNEKSYVYDETRSPGGNAINVARILTRLRIPVISTGFLGGGTGDEIRSLLDDEGVRNRFISIESHSRISVTVSNLSDHRQTRLSFPGPHIKKTEKAQLFRSLRQQRGISLLVIGGSLPMGFKPSDVVRLVKDARKRNIPAIVDCPGNILREIIPAGPVLIKPNLDEFQALTGSKVRSLKAVYREARKFLAQVPLICISSVEGGALLVTKENAYFGRIAPVKVKSTVGAGDSMVGAMVAQLYKNDWSGVELLRWGLAASAATLSHSGTAMGTAQEIRRLYKITKVESVRI